MFISKKKEPLMRVELMTPSLPRMYSTTELQRLFLCIKKRTLPLCFLSGQKYIIFLNILLFVVNFFNFFVTC